MRRNHAHEESQTETYGLCGKLAPARRSDQKRLPGPARFAQTSLSRRSALESSFVYRYTSFMHQPSTVRLASLTLSFLLAVVPAWPWGREGHRVVALIAAKNLSAAARAKAAAILGTNDAGLDAAMAAAATWPDEINKPATGTANWHFVDVPVT